MPRLSHNMPRAYPLQTTRSQAVKATRFGQDAPPQNADQSKPKASQNGLSALLSRLIAALRSLWAMLRAKRQDTHRSVSEETQPTIRLTSQGPLGKLEANKNKYQRPGHEIHFFTPEDASAIIRILTGTDISMAPEDLQPIQLALNELLTFNRISTYGLSTDDEGQAFANAADDYALKHQAIVQAIQAQDPQQLSKALDQAGLVRPLAQTNESLRKALFELTFQQKAQALKGIRKPNLANIATMAWGEHIASDPNLANILKSYYYTDLTLIQSRYRSKVDRSDLTSPGKYENMNGWSQYLSAIKARSEGLMLESFNQITGLKESTMDLSSPLGGPNAKLPHGLSPNTNLSKADALKMLWVRTQLKSLPPQWP